MMADCGDPAFRVCVSAFAARPLAGGRKTSALKKFFDPTPKFRKEIANENNATIYFPWTREGTAERKFRKGGCGPRSPGRRGGARAACPRERAFHSEDRLHGVTAVCDQGGRRMVHRAAGVRAGGAGLRSGEGKPAGLRGGCHPPPPDGSFSQEQGAKRRAFRGSNHF